MLPIRGNAHLCQGEKGRSTAVCGWQLQKKDDQMHAQRVDIN